MRINILITLLAVTSAIRVHSLHQVARKSGPWTLEDQKGYYKTKKYLKDWAEKQCQKDKGISVQMFVDKWNQLRMQIMNREIGPRKEKSITKRFQEAELDDDGIIKGMGELAALIDQFKLDEEWDKDKLDFVQEDNDEMMDNEEAAEQEEAEEQFENAEQIANAELEADEEQWEEKEEATELDQELENEDAQLDSWQKKSEMDETNDAQGEEIKREKEFVEEEEKDSDKIAFQEEQEFEAQEDDELQEEEFLEEEQEERREEMDEELAFNDIEYDATQHGEVFTEAELKAEKNTNKDIKQDLNGGHSEMLAQVSGVLRNNIKISKNKLTQKF